jgi:branched-chain amino acid transport system ATP-binding protein
VRRRVTGIIVALVVVVVLFTAPSWATSYQVLVGFEVFQLGALAQAWSLLAGYGGIVSLATSAFVGAGAYAAAKFSIYENLPFFATLLIAGVVAAILAVVISIPMFRFRGLYFTIATLVLSVGAQIFFSNNEVFGGSGGLIMQGYVPSDAEIYDYSLVLVVITTAVVWWVARHKLGLGLRAIRDDEDVASRMGVPVFNVKLIGFIFAAFIMGIVGAIEAERVGSVAPSGAFDFNWTIDTVNAAIIGGVGTIAGPIVGSAISIAISESLANYAALHLVITGVILILVIRLLPKGVWGTLSEILRRRSTRLSAFLTPSTPTVGAAPVRTDRPRSGGVLMNILGVGKTFGGVPAVRDVSFEIHSDEIVGIVGPNGAGKSTLIGLLSGAVVGTGHVSFDGTDITSLDARARARLGVGRTHQVPRPFEQLTVLENLLVARRYSAKGSLPEDTAECMAILERCGIADFANTNASELGLLRLKRLELARALALRPRLLLLDEIGAGLIKSEVDELIALIAELRSEVESIVIVEHVIDVIRECCDRLVVVNRGEKLLEGNPDEVLGDQKVAEVYLGTAGGDVPSERAVQRVFEHPLLEVRNISAQYGKHIAIQGISFEVSQGEIVALLGANGAGKSTVAKTLGGSLPVSHGDIHLEGKRVSGKQSHELVRLGVAHCMEGRRIFADLSVEENLLLGGRAASPTERRRRLKDMYELFPDLEEKRKNSGAGLSGGQQQMLAIGRALMSAPRFVIFDEISLGLAPITVDRLYNALRDINRNDGVSMLIIEQNVERGLALADRVVVLEKGAVALTGTPDEIRKSPELHTLYVG